MPNTTQIAVPEIALIVLIGASGSGKSTFAKTHFKPTEVLSSDFFRGLISDDENDQTITGEAFETLHYVAAKRLANYKLTVVDATNVQESARKPLVALAKQHHVFPIAIILDLPEDTCRQRNKNRPDRNFGDHVIGQQCSQLRRSFRRLKREGFRRIYTLRSEEEIKNATITREKVWTNRRDEYGPFDIIGDIHGCYDELLVLLDKLGYTIQPNAITPPPGRKALFLGDLCDRGPKTPEVIDLVMRMIEADTALCVPGNHDVRLVRALQGKNVKPTYGLFESLEQLKDHSDTERKRYATFLDSLVSHYVLDNGKLVVAHAGMKEDMAGRTSGAVRSFALYGETTGETDEFGLPIRLDWATQYRGKAMIVYGHTPVPNAEWLNNTINIDTGCVFGGELTALRYPEKELVSVSAHQTYAEPVRPLISEESTRTAQQSDDDMLDISDLLGKHIVDTALIPRITIREEHSIAAIEVMSRYAIDPKWLIYLPPTMSPSHTSSRPDMLEHPDEAFTYFRENDISQIICEEKHMGSRAIVIICKNDDVACERFGLPSPAPGTCYTRTGRAFFDDPTTQSAFLKRIQTAVSDADLWNELNTDWMALDCELMPWSARAQQLLQDQYAAVGTSATASLDATIHTLQSAPTNPDIAKWLSDYTDRAHRIKHYINAYRAYCWPVNDLTDLKLAPFHILATEGHVYTHKPHTWHLNTLAKLCTTDPDLLHATTHHMVDLNDNQNIANTISWWETKTAQGGEGMVIKPLDFIAQNKKGRLMQPAIKCRGREYLRIIYGPEYTTPANLKQLSWRNIKTKQSLALREFALGLEGLERFVQREPLRRIHECVFGVLALESEPVDPRL